MVLGIPVVIGARKGFPNFNEFSMQTQLQVARLLEFRRQTLTGPVVQTNPMYVLGISNVFGLEAWNAYRTNYPRRLQLTAAVRMTAMLTNELGVVLFSNTVASGVRPVLGSNSWSGWTVPWSVAASMVLPFGTTNSFLFLTNSSYINQPPWFVAQNHTFAVSDFYVPRWWVSLRTRLSFILVDLDANRIVDYVNLSGTEPILDLTTKLTEGNSLLSNPLDYRNPANAWLPERPGSSTNSTMVTYGIMNQIQTGLSGTTDWRNYTLDPYCGTDPEYAVDSFRYNLLNLAPIYPKDMGLVFYQSNVFYAPFDPIRQVYIHFAWQANDPLVHSTIYDLLDPNVPTSNRVDFLSHTPPLDNLGQINERYAPWGGNPAFADPSTDSQQAVKDPGIGRPDDWDFPTNQALGIGWVGRVHRGTPWQTIFLKSTNILLATGASGSGQQTWERWTGNSVTRPDWLAPGRMVSDAAYTAPTNDWHLVSLLNSLFNPADIHSLASPNQGNLSAWEALLDGVVVLTNSGAGQWSAITMRSNDPPAAVIAQALLDQRASEPGGVFDEPGDLLRTPELSVASPWLGTADLSSLTDAALETIPSQLLPRLRNDSYATPTRSASAPAWRFSGMDGYWYAAQISSDLVNWVSISTNTPFDGVFELSAPGPVRGAQFYRSVLLP